MSTSPPPTDPNGPQIPDFEKDAASIAAYEEAKQRFERREASDAESKTRNSFAKKREAIRAEIAVAASLLEERRNKAQRALTAYAARYPKNMDRNKPLKPGLWQNLFSFGQAGRLFNSTVKTAADALQAQSLRRRKEHDEEELEVQLKRALYLQEESIKKKLESTEGIDAFHLRPGVSVLYKRVLEIKSERAHYAERLAKGAVPPTEQRDREFSERKISQLEAPFSNMIIARAARYGDFTYFLLRDNERRLFHLAYDPRLEPLIDSVFDVFRLADAFEAKVSRGSDGRAMSMMDHFAQCYRDEEVARNEYRKQRQALRAPRDYPVQQVLDATEQQLIEILATFARTFAGASPRHRSTRGIPRRQSRLRRLPRRRVRRRRHRSPKPRRGKRARVRLLKPGHEPLPHIAAHIPQLA